MKLSWDFIQNIHKTVEKFPEEKKKLEMLYPQAFEKHDITKAVEIKLECSGGYFYHIGLYYRGSAIGILRFSQRNVEIKFHHSHELSESTVVLTEEQMNLGFFVDYKDPFNDSAGFRIFKYGPMEDPKKTEEKCQKK